MGKVYDITKGEYPPLEKIGCRENWLELTNFLLSDKRDIECSEIKKWDVNFLKGLLKIQYMPNGKLSDKQFTQLFRIGRLSIGASLTVEYIGKP